MSEFHQNVLDCGIEIINNTHLAAAEVGQVEIDFVADRATGATSVRVSESAKGELASSFRSVMAGPNTGVPSITIRTIADEHSEEGQDVTLSTSLTPDPQISGGWAPPGVTREKITPQSIFNDPDEDAAQPIREQHQQMVTGMQNCMSAKPHGLVR
ncbi:MAG: hypothetical protein AAF569_02070 [Pseudomonadota bacterium]